MTKKLWLIAGIAGALLGNPAADATAELTIHIGVGNPAPPPPMVIETRPRFMPLPDMGFAMAIDSPYDIIFFGNAYYTFHNGTWYGSGDYRGPWVVVRDGRLPYAIGRHSLVDIRRSRDVEYRRHDRRYDGRYDWDDRRRQRVDNRDNRFEPHGNRAPQRMQDRWNDIPPQNQRNQDQRNPGNDNRPGPDGGRHDDGGRRN